MTIDTSIESEKYDGQELTTDSGNVDNWRSVKKYSFTDAGTAFSGIFNSWCIGCSVPLDAARSGAIAYFKEDAFKAVQESTSLMENSVMEYI